MSGSNISAVLAPADLATTISKVSDIRALLPFLINMTPEERHKIRKMGTKREGYFAAVYPAALGNPSVIPLTFDMAEFTKDKTLRDALLTLKAVLAPLNEALDDTIMELNHELIKQTDQCYGYLQQGAEGNVALSGTVQGIAAQFAGQGVRAHNTVTTLPAGGSVSLRNVDTSRKLINTGRTIIGYLLPEDVLTNIRLVNPNDSVVLTSEFTKIMVINQSTTTAGEFSLKQKT